MTVILALAVGVVLLVAASAASTGKVKLPGRLNDRLAHLVQELTGEPDEEPRVQRLR